MTGLIAIGVASFIVRAVHKDYGHILAGRPKK